VSERDHDEQVRALVAPGWPAVESRIDEIFGWLEDPNCTGCGVAFEFLKSVGAPLLPHVRRALKGAGPEVRSVLLSLLDGWSPTDVRPLTEVLVDLSETPDPMDSDVQALGLLVKHRLMEREWLVRRVDGRIRGQEWALAELRSMRKQLEA